eukprot:210006-Hanusia_phi.AAC.1
MLVGKEELELGLSRSHHALENICNVVLLFRLLLQLLDPDDLQSTSVPRRPPAESSPGSRSWGRSSLALTCGEVTVRPFPYTPPPPPPLPLSFPDPFSSSSFRTSSLSSLLELPEERWRLPPAHRISGGGAGRVKYLLLHRIAVLHSLLLKNPGNEEGGGRDGKVGEEREGRERRRKDHGNNEEERWEENRTGRQYRINFALTRHLQDAIDLKGLSKKSFASCCSSQSARCRTCPDCQASSAEYTNEKISSRRLPSSPPCFCSPGSEQEPAGEPAGRSAGGWACTRDFLPTSSGCSL